jgi:hypothetical protein
VSQDVDKTVADPGAAAFAGAFLFARVLKRIVE